MKICHIITGLNNGGAEAVLYRLCQHDKRNDLTVISLMDEGKYGQALQNIGVKVYCLNMSRGMISVKGLIVLYRIIRSVRPDVVQTWMYHADLIGGVIARIARIKKVFWNIRHTEVRSLGVKLTTRLIIRICSLFSYIVPSKIVCCAKSAMKSHVEIGFCKKKLVVISNGYELTRFSIDESKKELVFEELGFSGLLLGMVGRFDPLKDHDNLFKSLSLLVDRGIDFKILLVGSGITKNNQELLKLIKQHSLNSNVFLLGERTDIDAVMNAIDIHVLSSNSEAFPNVLAEAMACGTPCVSTDVGDACMIIGETGWIVPPRNPLALADAIQSAIDEKQYNEAEWEKRREAARLHIVKNFSLEKMSEKYQALWLN